MFKKNTIIIFLAISLVCINSNNSFSDIYMYIDSSGIVHFTNAPTSTDYKLYMKERKQRIQQTINTKKI